MHSIVNKYSPKSLHNIFQQNDQRDINQDLRNANEYSVPFPRIELFKKSLLFSLPTAWNNLTVLKFYQNKTTFIIALKDDLINSLHN
jgi:hypothetical protein